MYRRKHTGRCIIADNENFWCNMNTEKADSLPPEVVSHAIFTNIITKWTFSFDLSGFID